MEQILIRNLPAGTKAALQARARRHHHSVEAEARAIWTTSVTGFEIRTGIELLVPSRRHKRLDEMLTQLIDEDLDGRVQSFDLTAATNAGTIAATQQRVGRAIEIRDVQIAGIAALQF